MCQTIQHKVGGDFLAEILRYGSSFEYLLKTQSLTALLHWFQVWKGQLLVEKNLLVYFVVQKEEKRKRNENIKKLVQYGMVHQAVYVVASKKDNIKNSEDL